MELNELQKWLIADTLHQTYNFKSILSRLENISRHMCVKLEKKTFPFQPEHRYNPIPYQIAILDFEGSPVILAGIMIFDTLFAYYIEDYHFINEFLVT